jgi:dUTP pyrophosphatase
MQIRAIHPNFQTPVRSSTLAGGYDLIMPESGALLHRNKVEFVGLGFQAAVPEGYVALILPRSGTGAKHGVQLRNTVGVIDADYRGEWKVAVSQREHEELTWAAGERLYQFLLVPVGTPELELVDALPETSRGEGGFGSTGE